MDMKEQIQEYVAPDLSGFDKQIAIQKEHQILTWKSKEIDIVELLCAATGQNLEEIGFGVISSTMMPYKDRGEEE